MKAIPFKTLLETLRTELDDSVAVEHLYLFSLVMEGIDCTGTLVDEGFVSRPSLNRSIAKLRLYGVLVSEPWGQGRKLRLTEKGHRLAEYIRNA